LNISGLNIYLPTTAKLDGALLGEGFSTISKILFMPSLFFLLSNLAMPYFSKSLVETFSKE